MCGICGTYGFGDKALLQRMCDIIQHRGPDDEGYYVDPHVGLGMRRLSIIDLAGGHQPIHNEDQTIWVVFNGEIYNFLQIRSDLKSRGHHFYTNTDTEVIVHAYEEYGDLFVEHLTGMFGLALWDSQRQRLVLVRDRVGIKPLYYRWESGRLWFASEIKSILTSDCSREMDFVALHQYLSYAHVPAPNTIFKGINKLLPGHMLICQDGKMAIKPYWDLPIPSDETLSWEDAKAKVFRLLEECVHSHLISDVPLGAFLSGGIDSSAIVGLMAKYTDAPVRTFSLGFESRARHFDELHYARLVAKHFGTEHLEIPVNVDVMKLLPRMIWHFDEPFANDTALIIYQLSQEVKKHVTVVLAGTGGDEVFAGYPRYLGMRLAELYSLAPLFLRKIIADLLARTISDNVDGRHLNRRLREFAQGGAMSPEDRYVSWITYFSEGAKQQLYSEWAKNLIQDTDGTWITRQFLHHPAGKKNFHDAVFYSDIKTYLPNDQLEYNEKMSMAHSLELRVPFCDHRLVEFAGRLPLSLKTRGFQTKRLLKEAMRGFLPDTIIDRPKLGLHAPVGIWLQTDLKPLVSNLLSRQNVERRGYFRYEAIKEMIGLHNAGKRDFSWQIWMLLVLEIWHRMYLDEPEIQRGLELDINPQMITPGDLNYETSGAKL
jgi:asparagine synthase (glutamine-hydrolysing)